MPGLSHLLPANVEETDGFPTATNQSLNISDVQSLPNTFDQLTGKKKYIDVLKTHSWTASPIEKIIDELPYIVLQEQRNNESAVWRAVEFYVGQSISTAATGTADTGGSIVNTVQSWFGGGDETNRKIPTKNILEVYDSMFPNVPTGLTFKLPFFTKQYVNLSTPEWNEMKGLTEAIGATASLASNLLTNPLIALRYPKAQVVGWGIKALQEAGGLFTGAGKTALKSVYPVVGIKDRPRYFSHHGNRTITIEFPLYNTLNSSDWEKNKTLIDIFLSQNLYSKRDYITGTPPCYYRVHAPGQYFCYAASLASLQVKNLGNVRLMETTDGKRVPVPDAYQVSIMLNEMVMPSLNQHQALFTGDAESAIDSTLKF